MVEWKKLGDICEIKGRIGFRGYTREDQVEKGNGAISLSPGNIFDSVLNYDSCTYITWEKYEESPEIMVNEGDIILCKTASVGKVARVKQLLEKATINPQLVLIKNIKTNPQYLFYILDDTPFQVKIKGLAGVGSVPNVSQAKLSSIQIPIPSLDEQNRIVGILDTFTASVDNLKEQIAQRRKQYEYYRDQLLDLEGKEGVEMVKLEDVVSKECTLSYGIVQPGEDIFDGVPVVRPIDLITTYVYRHGLKNTTKDISDSYRRTILKGKEILFCVRGTTGIMSLATQELDGCNVTRGIVPISFDNEITKMFVYYQLRSRKLQKVIADKTNGTALKQINIKDLRQIKLLIPSLSEQQRIVDILDKFEASIQNLEAQLSQREKQYEYYRNKLLTFE